MLKNIIIWADTLVLLKALSATLNPLTPEFPQNVVASYFLQDKVASAAEAGEV